MTIETGPNRDHTVPVANHTVLDSTPTRIVLVLQGGGALGAYQAGVYEAMHEAGLRPDWVIGTSVGAINAALIAGNRPERRIDRLKTFWKRIERGVFANSVADMPFVGRALSKWITLANGVEGFFTPNALAFASPTWPLGTAREGYYSTGPLRATLSDLLDFDRIQASGCRLTVGAANIRTAKMRYFDSRDTRLDVRHVMASGALPPAFPPVQIGDDFYWDGGLLSNTPVEAVFDDYPRRSGLVFSVHLWNPDGPDPETIADTMLRQKDIQYASRAHSHIVRQQQIHRLRHIIAELAARLPPSERARPEVEEMAGYGCLTQMHVVRLLAPAREEDDQMKDVDFSPASIAARWKAGLDDTRAVLRAAPWSATVDPLAGFVLHEAIGGEIQATVHSVAA